MLWSRVALSQTEFVENKGQWPDQVLFKASLPSGSMWAEQGAFTFSFYNPQILEYLHPQGKPVPQNAQFASHAYKINFVGSSTPEAQGEDPQGHYYNYYLGNDESSWASGCRAFRRCALDNIYDNIDLLIYSSTQSVKYDFIVRAGGQPQDIRLELEGAEVFLEPAKGGNQLHVRTSVNDVIEKPPFAYQIINGIMEEVSCEFVLKENIISFKTGRYNHHYDLIIDPEIAFSTYIGSTASNFGFTACDDSQGNLISGAAVFAENYPTTTGAFQADYNSDPLNYMDVAVTKFNVDGSALLYSTYIGGPRQETPHSIVADSNDNFIVFGVTGSDEFPTTAGCWQSNFIGGPFLPMADFFTSFHESGTDMFLSKFDAAGALLSSTFIGGNGNDGLNYADELFYNYGDAFRGEVNLDAANNIYVASVTKSTNFPMEGSSNQTAFGGGMCDGVVFKMDPTLNNMLWSTYVGGSNSDACYAIEFESDGTLIIAGGTQSSNFSFISANAADPTHNGQTDGFIFLLDNNNFTLQGGTFVGTGEYDQVYFIQTDDNDNVYAYGQTEGNMPLTPGVYGQANSGQFVLKLDPLLSSQLWNTTIGTGSGEIDISPTAFLVSDCEQIYISGWGGDVNSDFCQFNPCYATSSTTFGLPVSADAFQPTTDGSDFYLCVLTPNAQDLLYASFLGGTESSEHVDGGTSRFDKSGSVFQAVCAGCQNNDDFPTTPGVWSNTNESNGCNIAVFRFDLSAVQAAVEIDGPDEVCIDDPVAFINSSVGASSYQWLFGDGGESTEFEPTHSFNEPGTYTIQLIGMDDALCVTSDTAEVQITILPGVSPSVDQGGLICPGDTFQLNATGSANLFWLASISISETDIPNPTASPVVTSQYFVVDFNECAAETLSVTVEVSSVNTDISDDDALCIGESTSMEASGGVSYSWSPTTGLNNPTSATPVCTPLETTTYTVTITNADDCPADEEVTITVFNNAPGGEIYDDLTICEGGYIQLMANSGTGWQWTPDESLSNANIQDPYANPQDTTSYAVVVLNACGQGTDYVTVNVIHPEIDAYGGGTICPGDTIGASASGGETYLWQPASFANPSNESVTVLSPPYSMWFDLTGVDQYNCIAQDSVYVYVHPSAQVDAGPDQYYEYPGSTYLLGNAFGYDFYWWPETGLSCTDCIYPVASPELEMVYHLSVIDHNGCITDDSVFVKPYYPVWVPNAFTPDNDGINDYFKAYGVNIEGFHMMIFDRWGIKVFESYDIDEVWMGEFASDYYVQNDVYNWVIEFDSIDRRTTMSGHVTLLR
jgi:gliding motility-associated-like protein